MRPLIKWAGGKSRQADTIGYFLGPRQGLLAGPCLGDHVEPFFGAGAVFLRRAAAGSVTRAVLSDANDKLIGMHLAVRNEPHRVIDALYELPARMWREVYYQVRDDFNAFRQEGAEHAARFIWLNHACFNGLYRENKAGDFNVPIGRPSGKPGPLSLPDREHILNVSRLLKMAEIVHADFRTVIARVGAGDQLYCDPPYVPLNATSFVDYVAGGFSAQDQSDLAAATLAAAQRGARVVVSNSDTEICRALYPSPAWTPVGLLASRSISRTGDRAKAKEVMFVGGGLT